jgi:hypothetical protein
MGRLRSSRAGRVRRHAIELDAARVVGNGRGRAGRRGRAPARGPKRIERIHPRFTRTAAASVVAPLAAAPGCSLCRPRRTTTPPHPIAASFHSRRRHFPARAVSSPCAPYLARGRARPPAPSPSPSARIRSSPSISRPLLFLLSICALSGTL